MKITKTFEERLKQCLDKYAKKPIADTDLDQCQEEYDNNLDEYLDEYEDIDDSEYTESIEIVDDGKNTEKWNKMASEYYFYYEITLKKKTMFDFAFYDDDDDDDENSNSAKNDQEVQINIFDQDLAKHLRKITEYSDLFSSRPQIELGYLYNGINDLRIRYSEIKYNKEIAKKMIDFIEDLFSTEINKMDNMIRAGKIDYNSLWYYYDKYGTIYKVKMQDKDVCYKHKYFEYISGTTGDKLLLSGTIYVSDKDTLKEGAFSHTINKFTGTRKINSFEIEVLSDEVKNVILKNATRRIELSKNYHYMYLKGFQYVLKQDAISSISRDERVIVDEEGMDKFANRPYDFSTTAKVDRDELTDEQKLLVFPFCSVYTLGSSKTWGMAYVDDLHEVDYQKDAFQYLVLDQSKKDIIKGLVTCHNNNNLTDFIRNKGLGLVFLLYGPPGVGKTLTAEATCEYLQKPLFNVSVCDLGTNPETMEVIMEQITEYVRRWKAVILIDEVDIFVEEREFSNVLRNALVSTFLKFLEYNDGIMFLTTNRLKSIDPAIKTRINLPICYPAFEKERREDVWRALLDKWHIEISKKTLNKLSSNELNGREIRNYMRLVVSIHKDRNIELTDESLLEVFEECKKLTEEFSEKIPQGMYN